MTDADLAAALCPDDPAEGEKLRRLMAEKMPAKLAVIERMVTFADQWNSFAAGEGPCPDMTGVMVDLA